MILGMTYSGPSNGSIGSLVVTTDSRVFTLTSDHREFDDVLEMLKSGRNDEAELALDRLQAVKNAVVNTKFSFSGNVVAYEGRALPTVMANYIIRMKDEGFNLTPLEKFTENLFENPSYRAIQEAFLFTQANEMPITDDGCFIGYRAVTSDYKDIRTNTFDNSIGSIVEEPRNMVDEDPTRTCSNGLHVCSLEYINSGGYGSKSSPWIIVKVNPKDIVAVPRDYNNTKLRCCKFEVIGELDRSKIQPGDTKSYRENDSVFQPTDQELIQTGKFYQLGEKHRKKNNERGYAAGPASGSKFDHDTQYSQYLAGYDGCPWVEDTSETDNQTPVKVAKAGTNSAVARDMFNNCEFAELLAFKKEKKVSLARLGFTAEEETTINSLAVTPEPTQVKLYEALAPASTAFKLLWLIDVQLAPGPFNQLKDDTLIESFNVDDTEIEQFINMVEEDFDVEFTGSEIQDILDIRTVGEMVRVMEEKIDEEKGAPETKTREELMSIVDIIKKRGTPLTGNTKSKLYLEGFEDGQEATSFLPANANQEYWTGFCDAWKENPHNNEK